MLLACAICASGYSVSAFSLKETYSFDSAVLGRPLAIPKLIALFNIKLSETPPSGKATKVLNLAADGLLDGYVITIDFSDSAVMIGNLLQCHIH
jgi:hypothetical protein